MSSTLVVVRHGESDWNLKNLFSGWKDIHLSVNGKKEARRAGQLLKREGIDFDIAFTSGLIRAWKTLNFILDEMDLEEFGHEEGLITISTKQLNERNYGDLTGLNKDDAVEKWGQEQVTLWRRSYETRPPGGESLKDTAERVIPYYRKYIHPRLLREENVIISAHANSLRALIMYLEKMTAEEISKFELPTARPIIYYLDDDAQIQDKKVIDQKAKA